MFVEDQARDLLGEGASLARSDPADRVAMDRRRCPRGKLITCVVVGVPA